MLKERIAPFVRPVPQYSAVALPTRDRPISLHLSWGGETRDITDDHSLASLRPLTIATGTDAGAAARLDYREEGRLLGSLHLLKSGAVKTISLYRIVAGEHRCLPWLWRLWNRRLQDRAASRNRIEHNFSLEPEALQQLMIFYICPRPVVLVSVSGADHFNVFPMDLIGSVGPHFTLALRSTNISIPVMRDGGKIALSCVPAEMKSAAYELARHHSCPSQNLKIPAVAAALRRRELTIRHAEEIGSHIFFIADILSDEPTAEGKQLHHVSGLYQTYRRRHGAAFPEAGS